MAIEPTEEAQTASIKSQIERISREQWEHPDLSVWTPDPRMDRPMYLGNDQVRLGFKPVQSVHLTSLQRGSLVYIEGTSVHAHYILEVLEQGQTIRMWRDKYGTTTALIGPMSAIGVADSIPNTDDAYIKQYHSYLTTGDPVIETPHIILPYFRYDLSTRSIVQPPSDYWKDVIEEIYIKPIIK